MAGKKRNTKDTVNIVFLSFLVIITLVGVLALFKSNGFNLTPRAATSTTNSMCQKECVLDYQCGQGQVCAQKPGSIDRKKYCYNPSCPENNQCGGEGCACRVDLQTGRKFNELSDCQAVCVSPNTCRTETVYHLGNKVETSYFCVYPNQCVSKDFIRVKSYTPGKNLDLTRKASTSQCKEQDSGSCPEGYICEKITNNGIFEGIKLTRVNEGGSIKILNVGTDCICREPDSSVEEIMEFCKEYYFENGYDHEPAVGQYIRCMFNARQCEGPFGS